MVRSTYNGPKKRARACPETRPDPAQPKILITCPPSGGSETLTGSMDRDFEAFGELLEALILASSGFSFILARSLVLRDPFYLAFEPLRNKSELPTGLRTFVK